MKSSIPTVTISVMILLIITTLVTTAESQPSDMKVDEVYTQPMTKIPEIIYVNSLNAGTQNGQSWATAYSNLGEALANAGSPCKIWVAAGTYTPTLPGQVSARTDTFRMKNGMEIYGGFPTWGNPGWEDRDWQKYETVLSGEIGNPDYLGDNTYHVIYNRGGTVLDHQAVIDGLTITSGLANGGYPFHNDGGGMYNSANDHPLINNCLFIGNIAEDGGGGIFNDNAFPVITNCTFMDNRADLYGGGIGNYYHSSPNLLDCTFVNNQSEYGGGISNNISCSPLINNGVFTANIAESGAGIHNFCDSNAVIKQSSFHDNEASESGGGICNGSASPEIDSCIFKGNSALGDGLNGGGGVCNVGSASPLISNSVFYDNSAFYYGGAVYNQTTGTPVMTNCTMVHNQANNGGSIYNRQSSPQITNCISWRNIAILSHDEIYDWASAPDVTYSDISGGYPGNGNISADPLIVNPLGMNFRLLPSSPCIDSGSNAASTFAGITADIYGDQRVFNGVIDIGADESSEWTYLIFDDNGNDKIDYLEMVTALMDYLTGQLNYSQMIDVLMDYLTS